MKIKILATEEHREDFYFIVLGVVVMGTMEVFTTHVRV
jgi:hypothetical protein